MRGHGHELQVHQNLGGIVEWSFKTIPHDNAAALLIVSVNAHFENVFLGLNVCMSSHKTSVLPPQQQPKEFKQNVYKDLLSFLSISNSTGRP